MANANISCEVIACLGILATSKNGWEKRVCLVSWNGNDPKVDIRDWSPEGKMSKGITLTEEEFAKLQAITL